MENNTERIIGSCLEINSDIIMMRYSDEKNYPEFFKSLREKYYKRKLINTVKKLEKANIPLNKNNLIELFACVYNNFPPYGKYQNIKQVLHVDKDNMNLWKAVIRYDESTIYSIDIDQAEEKFTVNIIIIKDDTRIDYTDYLTELISKKEKTKDFIANLNKLLIKIIMDYILYIINSTESIERKDTVL